jgi:hypothetical protein
MIAGVPWKLTVREGSRVQRARFDDLSSALQALETQAGELAKAAPNKPFDVRYKSYEPVQQVFARLELAGPERLLPSTRAGLDVRGDGSVEAFRGRVSREVVEPRRGETPYAALRRALERGS